tara:strand:+ start:745 stop:2172 length:1428 start_codon:yes stop_codon:yes gene_type:complete
MKNTAKRILVLSLPALLLFSCAPVHELKEENRTVPESFQAETDTLNSAQIAWREFFQDSNLVALIDTALKYNQEFNINLQEMARRNNEILARKGEYLPFAGVQAGAGVDKTARYTPLGANEATTDIAPGRAMPDPVPDLLFGATASWEIDIWHKLHDAKDAAVAEYMASIEGRHFMQTELIAEIASSYYELLALDNQLKILDRNIALQNNALEIVKLQKIASKVNELAVRRFEAQVLRTKSLRFGVLQQIRETENKLHFLLGSYPGPIRRSSEELLNIKPAEIHYGKPVDLLANRPDIREAERELEAAELQVKVARAQFYPSLDLSAGLGMQAFNASYLVTGPESMLYNLAGDLSAPLINRRALKASYANASATQIEMAYRYEMQLLQAYLEVSNQVSKITNLNESLKFQSLEVDALNESITISNDLFKSARADYMEVLMTQRDALESKFELIETKKEQLIAQVVLYQTLGGGWQ